MTGFKPQISGVCSNHVKTSRTLLPKINKYFLLNIILGYGGTKISYFCSRQVISFRGMHFRRTFHLLPFDPICLSRKVQLRNERTKERQNQQKWSNDGCPNIEKWKKTKPLNASIRRPTILLCLFISFTTVKPFLFEPVWPDGRIKSSQISSNVAKNEDTTVFTLKLMMLLKKAKHFSKYLGYFYTKVCHHEL